MALWPSPSYGGGTLPDNVHGGAVRPVDQPGTIEFETDQGPPQRLRVSQLDGRALDFSLTHMSDVQVKELDAFYVTATLGGVDPFQWKPPEANGGGDPLVFFQFRTRPVASWVKYNDWTIQVRLRQVP